MTEKEFNLIKEVINERIKLDDIGLNYIIMIVLRLKEKKRE